MTRHRFGPALARTAALVALAIVAGECPAPAQSPPIKIGLLMPGTGPFTVNRGRPGRSADLAHENPEARGA
jgi:hypothetical protein